MSSGWLPFLASTPANRRRPSRVKGRRLHSACSALEDLGSRQAVWLKVVLLRATWKSLVDRNGCFLWQAFDLEGTLFDMGAGLDLGGLDMDLFGSSPPRATGARFAHGAPSAPVFFFHRTKCPFVRLGMSMTVETLSSSLMRAQAWSPRSTYRRTAPLAARRSSASTFSRPRRVRAHVR